MKLERMEKKLSKFSCLGTDCGSGPGSGSGLDPDSTGSLDPDPGARKWTLKFFFIFFFCLKALSLAKKTFKWTLKFFFIFYFCLKALSLAKKTLKWTLKFFFICYFCLKVRVTKLFNKMCLFLLEGCGGHCGRRHAHRCSHKRWRGKQSSFQTRLPVPVVITTFCHPFGSILVL